MLAESCTRRRHRFRDGCNCHAAASMGAPDISVVVPSHGRRLRLWWLLHALEDQSVEATRFEVVVAHDYVDPDFLDALHGHPLARDGRLRLIAIEPGTGRPSLQRNLGWRDARAPLIAFTDDDCRVDRNWLKSLLEAAALHPGAILQGRTRPDPLEDAVFAAPHHRSLDVDPPTLHAQTCNIAYPRKLLERIGGFDESMPAAAGEDVDLALRAKATGAVQVVAPGALVYHAVESFSLLDFIRMNRKWEHLPLVLRRHPELRGDCTLGIFWRPTHLELLLALGAIPLSRKSRGALLLAAPYLKRALNARGPRKRARLAAAIEFPGRVVVDTAEVATLIRGSVRYRTLLL